METADWQTILANYKNNRDAINLAALALVLAEHGVLTVAERDLIRNDRRNEIRALLGLPPLPGE